MWRVEVDQRKAITIDGTYFNKQAIIPYPTQFNGRDIKEMTEDIFNKVNNNVGGFPTGSFTTIQTDKYLSKTRRVFKQEIRNALDDDLNEDTTQTFTTRLLNDVFPSEKAYSDAPNEINSEAVSTHITRVLVQSLYEEMNSLSDETHMFVYNPLDIKNHKWNEVPIDKPVDPPIEYHVSTTHALVVDSGFLTKPVYMHAPDTAIVPHTAAKEATKEIFDRVNEEFNINTTDEFTALTPIDFGQSLNEIVKEELVGACKLDLERSKSTIYRKVNTVFPNSEKYDTYPDKIYCKNVIWHITRMVVQTVLDFLTTKQPTHMVVSDPFNISEHKWDEIPITSA